jgi:protein SCO1/2
MMSRANLIRLGLLVLAAIAGGYLWYLGSERAQFAQVGETTGEVAIGGPFSLVDQDGMRRTERDFQGKPMLVFFGFTHCPDVCPTTLSIISATLERLGPDADRLTPIFITVDPRRDRPEQLKGYLASFDPRFVGLTGTEQEVAAVTSAYKVYARPQNADPDAMFDHSSIIYLMDANNRYLAHYTLETKPEEMAASIKTKLDEAQR